MKTQPDKQELEAFLSWALIFLPIGIMAKQPLSSGIESLYWKKYDLILWSQAYFI